eukprot:scaffold30641_cov129-Isochrysis_galbana.AAC.3
MLSRWRSEMSRASAPKRDAIEPRPRSARPGSMCGKMGSSSVTLPAATSCMSAAPVASLVTDPHTKAPGLPAAKLRPKAASTAMLMRHSYWDDLASAMACSRACRAARSSLARPPQAVAAGFKLLAPSARKSGSISSPRA